MTRHGVVTTAMLSQCHRAERDPMLLRLAARQHGVVTLEQLVALGFAASTVRARIAAKRLTRLHRGVYAVLPVLDRRGYWMAAVLSCGPAALLSYRSSAVLQTIRRGEGVEIDVSVAGRPGFRRAGIAVHRGESIVPSEVTEVDGIPCTTVARTIVDLAAVLDESSLEYAIHRAQSSRRFDRSAVIAAMCRMPGRPGSAALRRILRISDRTEDELRSWNERRFWRLVKDAELPLPEAEVWIPSTEMPAGGLEVDFAWRQQRLAVEIDTPIFHGTDRAAFNDPRRDRALMLAGWRPARFTDRDLDTPTRVVYDLRSFLNL
jgi:predicted transcriptional regulator of viral defense system